MRTAKIHILGTLIFIFSACSVIAQEEYKVAMNSGTLIIKDVNELTIEGYDGTEVVFKYLDGRHSKPDKAKGLRAINSLGMTDNSGIGLSVRPKDGNLEVASISKNSEVHYRILVPKSVGIFYEHNSNHGEELFLKNIQSEIEVTTRYNDIFLENVTGPMAIKSVHGDINADFSKLNQEGSISLHSVHGDIDASFPIDTKANFMLKSSHGEMYTDLDLKIDADKADVKSRSSKNISGTLNGGGVDVSIKTSHSNIYLRKK